MIRAVSWFCADHHGVFVPGGRSWQKPSPKLSVAADILALVGRPVNYYPRMTTEARHCLCAASMALAATPWRASGNPEIGLLCGGSDGCLAANQEYFRDYVASGRSLGRGNLFIYTLPTSVLGEVAIVLSLAGPCLFIHDETRPLSALARHSSGVCCRWRGKCDAGPVERHQRRGVPRRRRRRGRFCVVIERIVSPAMGW